MLISAPEIDGWGGGGGDQVWVTTALLKPDHITGSPVVTSIQVLFLGYADIGAWNRCPMSI